MSQNIINIKVEGQKINISGVISLKLLVSNQFEYVGSQEITIYGTSKVFHHIFATPTKNKQQERTFSKLFFLQYEYYLPEFEQSYNYKSKDIIELGGISWQRDNFIDKSTYDEWDPRSDVYQLIAFLEKKDLKFPVWTWNNRLATMLNEEKSQELLLLYIEKIPEIKMEKLFLNGELIDLEWEKEKPELKKRGLLAFSLL